MDKWFSVGELLDYINKNHHQFITLIRRSKSRIEEMEKIPADKFSAIAEKKGITCIKTNIRNYTDELRLIVIEEIIDNTKHYFGYFTNDYKKNKLSVISDYSKRWGIEFWFNEGDFIGLNSLPSIELNTVTTALALKMAAYYAVNNFRANLGNAFAAYNIESIFEKFFNKQALIILKKDVIEVTMFGHPYSDILNSIYQDLSNKLLKKNINPNIPWLNNYKLQINFK